MVVYIAGPYRGRTPYQVEKNIARAKKAALKVWKAGHIALCPHMNTANFDGELPDEVWMDGALELMLRCDVVLVLKGWDSSKGSRAEVTEAMSRGMLVVEDIDTLRRERFAE